MNDCNEVLAFVVGSKILPAKHEDKPVTKEVWVTIVNKVKAECASL
jgi:hypothetical protein